MPRDYLLYVDRKPIGTFEAKRPGEAALGDGSPTSTDGFEKANAEKRISVLSRRSRSTPFADGKRVFCAFSARSRSPLVRQSRRVRAHCVRLWTSVDVVDWAIGLRRPPHRGRWKCRRRCSFWRTNPHGNRVCAPGAEGEGFEPSSDLTARNGFRDRRIRPLCHPSGPTPRGRFDGEGGIRTLEGGCPP